MDYQERIQKFQLMSNAQPPLALLQGSVAKLTWAVHAVDQYLAAHSEAVARLAEQIARQMGFSDSIIEAIRFGALLHDIGKINLPDVVLHKRSALTPEECEIMKTHPLLGTKILEPFETQVADWVRMNVRNNVAFDRNSYETAIKVIRNTVRHHHEAFDGSGYPDQLRGDNIPLAARIVAVPNYFDMITDSAYRQGCSVQESLAEIRRCSGTQFDPDIVEAFVRALSGRESLGASMPG
jgi:putative nucleotidyltransferase with HDIG domain